MVLKFILFFLFFNIVSIADDSFLGQKDFRHYYGPTYPIQKINFYNLNMSFEDSYYEKNYIETKVQTEIFSLNDFFVGELYQGLNCPDIEYKKLHNDIQFYIRLLTLSFLHQSMSEMNYNLKRVASKKLCYKKIDGLFKQCKPNSTAMRQFITNSKRIVKDTIEYIPFEEGRNSSVNSWIQSINTKKSSTLALKLLRNNCDRSSCNNKKNVSKKLVQVCREQKEIFQNVCSEKDKNYGLSYIPEVYYALTAKGTFLSTENSYFAGCLKRFIETNAYKEFRYPILNDIFTYKVSENIKRDSLRGKLFKVGELREIHKKGLKDIFQEKKKNKVKKIVQKVNTKPTFKKIILPKYQKVEVAKKVKLKAKPIKKIKKENKQSAFYVASKFRKKFDVSRVQVDMRKFKYDYFFNLEFIKKFEPTIRKFSSIKSLNDMKKYDKLGTKKSPVPLKFLKFLMDREEHRNIYNIIQIIGNEFYVENDIDQENFGKERVFIDNSEATNHKWQIFVIKPD